MMFNDNNNEDDEKIIFKEESNSNNYQNLKMKEIKYFEKLLEDETYKKYDKMYFFNFQRKKENYKLNLEQIQKYNNIPQYEIKKISEISKYTSKLKNSSQDRNLIESIFYPNKATKKQLSTKGTEIDIMALILYTLHPVQQPMIYLEEKGGMIRDYSISIIIDNSKSCFSAFNEKHSYLTIINLFKIINSMSIPSFDPSVTIFKNDLIFEKLLKLISNPISNSDLSKSIKIVYDLKKMKRCERESYLFILTDGLSHKYNEKKINYFSKLCQNIGIKVFCIGIGVYPFNAKEIFENFIYSENPEYLLKI